MTLFILDAGHFLHQVYPGVDSQDFDTLQLKVIEIQKQLGVDVFVRLLHGIYDPIAVRMAGLNVTRRPPIGKCAPSRSATETRASGARRSARRAES